MKKSAYKFHEKILMGVYFLSLGGAVATAVMSEGRELHQNINLCIWISSSIMWSHIYIMLRHKRDNLIEAAAVPSERGGTKSSGFSSITPEYIREGCV